MTVPAEALADVPLYVVDTSVWARTGLRPPVRQALAKRGETGILAMAPPVALEVGYSARDARAWDQTHDAMADLLVLPMSRCTYEIARDLQRDLWHHGLARAVGCTDLLIAAVAIEGGATVLHYERAFEHLAQVRPGFRQEWVVPPGSVD